MKFIVKLRKKGFDHDSVEFDSSDSGSVCLAMGYISQAIKYGYSVKKIEDQKKQD